MKLQVLTTFDNPISANILKTKLESEGIPCFLNNEYTASIIPQYFSMLGAGVQVLVPEVSYAEAVQIAQISGGTVCCPACKSTNVSNAVHGIWNRIKYALILLVSAAPIGNLLNDYRCNDCGEYFKK